MRPAERELLDHFLRQLRGELGNELEAVWLYGSRARGEPPGPESDVDLLVLTRAGRADFDRIYALLWANFDRWPDEVPRFAPHPQTSSWIEGRREIEAFFIQEVDRDKVVLIGAG